MFTASHHGTDRHKHAVGQADCLRARLLEENTPDEWDGSGVSAPSIQLAPLKEGHTGPISVLIQFEEDAKLSWFWIEMGVIPDTKWCLDAIMDDVPNEMEWRFENYDELVTDGLPYYVYVRTYSWRTVVCAVAPPRGPLVQQ